MPRRNPILALATLSRRKQHLWVWSLGGLLAWFSSGASAAETDTANLSAKANVSTESLWWDKSLNLRAGFGFKDNVLLSSVTRRESLFVATGLDAMLLRLPVAGPEFYLFLTGDDTRYLKDVGVDGEQTLAAVSRLQTQLSEHWQAALGVQYFYQNQVLDVSTTEAELTTIPITGHNIKVAPAITRQIGEHYSLQLEISAVRQFLEKPLDHYWESGPKLTLERPYGRKSAVSVSYAARRRFYDTREQTARNGVSQAGSALEFDQHQFELADRHYWDEKRRWRTDTKAGLELNADNGSGFFDYQRYQLSQQIRYTAEAWAVKTNVRFSFYDYSVQTANTDGSASRQLTTLNWTLRGEKNLTKSLKWFAEFEHEQNLSNRPADGYHATSVLTGVDWEL